MAQTTIIFTNKFSDGSTRNLEIGKFSTSSISLLNIRAAVKDLNNNPSAIANIYLSENGANFQEISQVKLTTENREIIL